MTLSLKIQSVRNVHIAVIPSCVALHDEIAGLAVVCEPFCSIVERDAVGDLVVCGFLVCFIATTQLEAVAVTLEVAEAPTLNRLACVDVVKGWSVH